MDTNQSTTTGTSTMTATTGAISRLPDGTLHTQIDNQPFIVEVFLSSKHHQPK